MMLKSFSWSRCSLAGMVVALTAVCLHCLQGSEATAQGEKDFSPPKAHVFVHPEKLTAKDTLTDGKNGKPIEIKSDATLVWIDLAPDAKFAHPTEYVLITASGSHTLKGHWWPVLNGKPLFRDTKPYQVEFPMKLSGQ